MKSFCLLVCLAACAGAPATHPGPVTATTRVGSRTFACSQAGIFELQSAGMRRVADAGWRAFALAGRTAVASAPALLLVGGGEPARSGRVACVTLAGQVLGEARIADDLIYSIAISPLHDFAVTGCADGGVRRLSLPSLAATSMAWHHDGPVVALAFTSDGDLLASAGYDGKILVGPAEAKAPSITVVDHTAPVTCLAWSQDRQLASGARDGKVRLHDRTGRLLRVWHRLGGAVTAVAFREGLLEYRVATGPGEADRVARVDLPQ
jgi:hypothetical protein